MPNDATLGYPQHASSTARDAVHVPIILLQATERFSPGEHFKIEAGNQAIKVSGRKAGGLGIVDPFINRDIGRGEYFYGCLYPNTVVGMVHKWVHPDLPDECPYSTEEDKAWVKSFAESFGQTYESLMAAASCFIDNGDWTYDNSERYKGVNFDTFWPVFSRITGQQVKLSYQGESPYTCSC